MLKAIRAGEGLGISYRDHLKLESVIPTRFNRQRREVCFVPEGEKKPILVPWEELVAWVTETQGVTEYGVQRQYGFGMQVFEVFLFLLAVYVPHWLRS